MELIIKKIYERLLCFNDLINYLYVMRKERFKFS